MDFFSDNWPQEVAALLIALIATLYLVKKLTGWPRRRKGGEDQRPDDVHMGSRLKRGLKKSSRSSDR